MTRWELEVTEQGGWTNLHILRIEDEQMFLNCTLNFSNTETNIKMIGYNNCSGLTDSVTPSLLLNLYCKQKDSTNTRPTVITILYIIITVLDNATGVLLVAVSAGWLGTFIWQRRVLKNL